MSNAVDFAKLAEELEDRFAGDLGGPWDEEDFNALALSAFRLQYDGISAFRGFCEGRGATPDAVQRWQDVPAVPARAFKHVDMAVEEPEVVFLTSGTTGGLERRGRHLVPRCSLYRASLLPTFGRHVLADQSRMPFMSLIPAADALPGSSLSFMVTAAAEAYATHTSWLVDGTGNLDDALLCSVMEEAARSGKPVVVLGTALALLHAVERLEEKPVALLPEGSRVMETGGFKGRGREIGRPELHERIGRAMGIPPGWIVGEYGMTELLSQLYEPTLSQGERAGGTFVAPPWLKVRALDPVTLDELESGRPGLLAFFDLANAGSVCHVLTEDVGIVADGRVALHGRSPGAEPRGCSRAMDELMSSAGRAR